MAERDVKWHWPSGYVVLDQAVDIAVPAEVLLTGSATKGEPDLEAKFEIRDGVPECVEFTLRSTPEGRGVRTSDLRLFNIEGLTHNAFIGNTRIGRTNESHRIGDEREYWAASGVIAEAQRRSRSVTQTELEDVARVYLENVAGNPTLAVAQGLEKSLRTAARRIKQAEEAGLLPPTTPGKKRGTP